MKHRNKVETNVREEALACSVKHEKMYWAWNCSSSHRCYQRANGRYLDSISGWLNPSGRLRQAQIEPLGCLLLGPCLFYFQLLPNASVTDVSHVERKLASRSFRYFGWSPGSSNSMWTSQAIPPPIAEPFSSIRQTVN